MTKHQLEIDNRLAALLTGAGEAPFTTLLHACGCSGRLRGNLIVIEASAPSRKMLNAALVELQQMAVDDEPLTAESVARVCELVADGQSPAGLARTIVWRRGDKVVAPRTENQRQYVECIREKTVTFGIGPAGTGKTYLAIALAAAALRGNETKRLVVTRPVVEAGEHLGFLPGDLMAKVDPYLRPVFDALRDLLGEKEVAKDVESGAIEVAPLAYMRGRSLDASFIILDEAQNATREQMKMFLTRLGSKSTMVVTGDPTQTDLPRGQISGLERAPDILSQLTRVGCVRFDERDVVRNTLVREIVAAYAEDERGTS
jgi:phosphate starvation-inducible protein PhoH and related proteins